MLILKIIPPQGVPLTPPPQRAVQLACNRAAAEAALSLRQHHFQAQPSMGMILFVQNR